MSTSHRGAAADWLRLALSPAIVRRASGVALVVGGILIAINHGDVLLRGELSLGRAVRIVLTAMVPYGVSTYSSVAALRARRSP
jgi:hypothetical protein